MIPKVIHYCWFGSNEKPKSVQKYIKNWHKMLPDFEIKEWNESNCDIENEIDYVKEAYQAKKYAFVSDYIRLKKLYEYGGVYFDTDIRVVKSFVDKLRENDVLLGLQSKGNITTAFMATVKGHPFFKDCIDNYQSRHFIDENGVIDYNSINKTMDPYAEKYGVDLFRDEKQITDTGITIYPIDYFSAFDIQKWIPIVTENTFTVHEMASSWQSQKVRRKSDLIKFVVKMIGVKNYERLYNIIRRK